MTSTLPETTVSVTTTPGPTGSATPTPEPETNTTLRPPTTTTVPTTTTPPTTPEGSGESTTEVETTTEMCPLEDGMSNGQYIPDRMVTGTPHVSSSSPSDARPGKDGWKVPVADQDGNPPVLIVDLTPNDDVMPPITDRVVVKDPQVKVVSVLTHTRVEFEDKSGAPTGLRTSDIGTKTYIYQVEKSPVPSDGVISLPRPTRVDEIRVVFEEPEEGVETYTINVQIYACFSYLATTTVPVTTTSVPVTTTTPGVSTTTTEIYTTTAPQPTTVTTGQPTTSHVVTETTTQTRTTTTVLTTTTVRVCNPACSCTLGCNGDIGNCLVQPGCDENCVCPGEYDERTNWRCAQYSDVCTTEGTTTTRQPTTTSAFECGNKKDQCVIDVDNCEVLQRYLDGQTFQMDDLVLMSSAEEATASNYNQIHDNLLHCMTDEDVMACDCPEGTVPVPMIAGLCARITAENCATTPPPSTATTTGAATTTSEPSICETARPMCLLSLTCEKIYSGMEASIETNLKIHKVAEADYGQWIETCIRYVTECGCEAPHTAGVYGNLCVDSPDCTAPCTCDGRFMEVGETCQIHNCSICTCGYEGGATGRGNIWETCEPAECTDEPPVCDEKCNCIVGCYGDQGDCYYKPECDPTACRCEDGMERINGRCVSFTLTDEMCEFTVTGEPSTTTATTTTGAVSTTVPPECWLPITDMESLLLRYDASSVLTTSQGDRVFSYDPESSLYSKNGWRSSPDDQEPSLIVVFRKVVNIAGFDIQPYSVDSMKVMLSEDGTTWTTYSESGQDKVWNFKDVVTKRTVALRYMQQAQYVKFVITKTTAGESSGAWVDVHGCSVATTTMEPTTTVTVTQSTTTAPMTTTTMGVTTTTEPTPGCMEPISKNAYILYEHEVSSTLTSGDFTYSPEGVDLSGPGWRSQPDDAQPHFTFIFRHIVNIAAFKIKTFHAAAVTLELSMNGHSWQTYTENGNDKVWYFTESSTERTFLLHTQEEAMHIRFTIQEKTTQDSSAGFNLEILGCYDQECPPGQILSDCMCWKSCQVMAAGETCHEPGSPSCRVGCQCPHGQVMHEGHCQPEEQCPCIYDGVFYAPGDQFPTEGECEYGLCTTEGVVIEYNTTCKQDNCTDGRVWTEIPCERTCQNPNPDCSDSVNVEPACACPHDEYWDGQKCVIDRSDCTCLHDGVLYHDGQVWEPVNDDGEVCVRCMCTDGVATCSEFCPLTEANCTAQGKKLENKNLEDMVCCQCVSLDKECTDSEGNKHKVGSVWSEGLCDELECRLTNDMQLEIIRTKITCPACRAGETALEVEGECCHDCVPVVTTTLSPNTTTTVVFTTTAPFTTTPEQTTTTSGQTTPEQTTTTSGQTTTERPTTTSPFEFTSTAPPTTTTTVTETSTGQPSTTELPTTTGPQPPTTTTLFETTTGSETTTLFVSSTQPPTTEGPTTTVAPTTTTSTPTCSYEGRVYQIGEVWSATADGCTTCTCREDGLSCTDTICDLTCDGILKPVPGKCCPECVPRDTSNCAHSVVPTEMKVGECVSKAKVNMTQCAGTCGSNATTVFMEPFVETNCKCCKPTSMTKQTVDLLCANGTTIVHEFVQIESCGCEACAYNPFSPAVSMTKPEEIITNLRK